MAANANNNQALGLPLGANVDIITAINNYVNDYVLYSVDTAVPVDSNAGRMEVTKMTRRVISYVCTKLGIVDVATFVEGYEDSYVKVPRVTNGEPWQFGIAEWTINLQLARLAPKNQALNENNEDFTWSANKKEVEEMRLNSDLILPYCLRLVDDENRINFNEPMPERMAHIWVRKEADVISRLMIRYGGNRVGNAHISVLSRITDIIAAVEAKISSQWEQRNIGQNEWNVKYNSVLASAGPQKGTLVNRNNATAAQGIDAKKRKMGNMNETKWIQTVAFHEMAEQGFRSPMKAAIAEAHGSDLTNSALAKNSNSSVASVKGTQHLNQFLFTWHEIVQEFFQEHGRPPNDQEKKDLICGKNSDVRELAKALRRGKTDVQYAEYMVDKATLEYIVNDNGGKRLKLKHRILEVSH